MADAKQVGALLVLTGIGLAAWSLGDKESTDRHEVSDKISEVRLDSPDADITIKVADVDQTTVEEKRHYWMVKRGDVYEVDGETLRLDGDCGWGCRADYIVTVPRGTRVSGEHGSGDLSVTGVSGVDATARSGDILLKDITGDVKLNITSGDVTVDRLTGKLDFEATSGDLEVLGFKGGPVTAKTTSGDLEIELDEAADVTAEGTSGDVRVLAPAGGYQVTADTSSGDVQNTIGNTSDGTHTIKATTTSGDVDLVTRR
ncbi:DUF4097 and DUF4098 domain-containing protein YvlB [Kribbella sp. VKM Ac-2527]|uniref:DUF4097 and DUF4098 domain-containing protein YvlB n=1 Tax=Kribbella caucasensis TaxID=2512215 RepID=A0A4V3CBA8_9ACTN|nr:DUF4097 family beta strand repeat-containing protein [Kribbella sp. VKM Ac-2527]TDO54600.1 DUF4097 and DUF4098 domain-containing protein YvlB [Kribbella sp. VKM Ac-2527]